MDIEDVVYIYTMEYYSSIKKDEIMPFAATWMDLEIIILNKSDRERQRQANVHCSNIEIAKTWKQKKGP